MNDQGDTQFYAIYALILIVIASLIGYLILLK